MDTFDLTNKLSLPDSVSFIFIFKFCKLINICNLINSNHCIFYPYYATLSVLNYDICTQNADTLLVTIHI